jgi:hypothetical protein
MTSRLDFADFVLKMKTKSAKSTNDLNEVDEVDEVSEIDEVDEVGEIDEVLARWRVFPAMSRIFCARLVPSSPPNSRHPILHFVVPTGADVSGVCSRVALGRLTPRREAGAIS